MCPYALPGLGWVCRKEAAMTASLVAGLTTVAAVTANAGAPSQLVAIPLWIEMVAIVVASVSGVLTAREKKLDLVGAVCLAVCCSLGGGLLRDMTLQVGNVYILNQPLALPASIITAAIVFVIPSLIEKQDRLIAVLDIFAVGLYAATGADKALVYGFSPLIGVVMGFFTGVGGGMLRDVLLGQTPYIFQRSNLYAVAAIAGALSYVLLVAAGVDHMIALIVCVVLTMSLRFLSLRYDIKSPTEVDLSRMAEHVPHPRLHRGEGGGRPRGSTLSAGELADRRERTLADIERRRGEQRGLMRRFRRTKR